MQALTLYFLCAKIKANKPVRNMTKPEIPTLDDVARRAKVSTATVSRCLNSPDQVSEGTRDRVLKIVKELGYSPNFGAQALAARRTNTFGAIVPTMNNAIFAAGLQAFQEELGQNGATLLLASSSYDANVEEEQIRSLVARGADGLLLIGTQRSRSIYNFLDDRQIPYVIAWSYQENEKQSCVGFDNFDAGYQLALKAINLGHERFAVISAYTQSNDRAKDRVGGILKALSDRGINTDSLPVIECEYSIQNGALSFKELMEVSTPPTIIMCGNDVLAAGAVKQAHEMGFKIPEEISITGFDNIELATVIEPALTTVHVRHKRMGRLAAKVLLKQVDDKSYRESVKLDTWIVEGKSLAKPCSAS